MQVTTEHIQPYDADHDASDVHTLWQVVFAPTWSINQERLNKVLNGPEPQHFVARINGHIVGFAATLQSTKDGQKVGQLAALLVHPELQRQGIGTALHATALAHLQTTGASVIQPGSIVPRFWPGIPTQLPAASAFFKAQGWEPEETIYDLSQDLSAYQTPSRIIERTEKEQISIASATNQNVTDSLAFEAKEFSGWLSLYERCADLGDYRDILTARDVDGRIIGTLIMYSQNSHPERTDLIWQDILGENAGAIGAVGVDAQERGRGIGIALVAAASEIQKQRAVQNCFIDWVTLTDFYAKVGYTKWREYAYCQRNL
jgi:GNAT superfamily N-acetyltransferase